MNTAVRTLQGYFAVPRPAATMKWGGGVFVALLATLLWVAWVQGGSSLATPMGQALAGSGLAALATALGALPALFIRRISARREDVMLGFGAGVMIAAACFSLILPGVAAGTELFGNKPAGALIVVVGFVAGALAHRRRRRHPIRPTAPLW